MLDIKDAILAERYVNTGKKVYFMLTLFLERMLTDCRIFGGIV